MLKTSRWCTIGRGLTAQGLEILTAASGEEALEILKREA